MNSPAFDPTALAGRVTLRPGPFVPGRPTITSTRPDWVSRLARGRQAAQLPDLLASVFTLCGHAHHWTSRRAILAAQGQVVASSATDMQRHRLATLREHLMRISHDWPRLLPNAQPMPDAALQLKTCPLWREDLRPEERLSALTEWLGQKWLGQPVGPWLQCYEADPIQWVGHWLRLGRTPLARLLKGQMMALVALHAPARSLDLLSATEPAALSQLAVQMRRPGFCARPYWQGGVPDSGPWSRRADPLRHTADTAWDRLLARWVEVLRLAYEPCGTPLDSRCGFHWPGHQALSLGPCGATAVSRCGTAWLAHGALALGRGEGVAWTEMARGLLVHGVQLGEDGRVQDCQVLAPTEWNFHPEGVLAQALRGLSADSPAELEAAACRLAVAFDPCVAFDVELVDA